MLENVSMFFAFLFFYLGGGENCIQKLLLGFQAWQHFWRKVKNVKNGTSNIGQKIGDFHRQQAAIFILVCFLPCCLLSKQIFLHKPSAVQALCDSTSRVFSNCLHQLKICCRKTALIGAEREDGPKGWHAFKKFSRKYLHWSRRMILNVKNINKHCQIINNIVTIHWYKYVKLGNMPLFLLLQLHKNKSICPSKIANCNISKCPVNTDEPKSDGLTSSLCRYNKTSKQCWATSRISSCKTPHLPLPVLFFSSLCAVSALRSLCCFSWALRN